MCIGNAFRVVIYCRSKARLLHHNRKTTMQTESTKEHNYELKSHSEPSVDYIRHLDRRQLKCGHYTSSEKQGIFLENCEQASCTCDTDVSLHKRSSQDPIA